MKNNTMAYIVIKLFNISLNYFNAKKSARYRQELVVLKLFVNRTRYIFIQFSKQCSVEMVVLFSICTFGTWVFLEILSFTSLIAIVKHWKQ